MVEGGMTNVTWNPDSLLPQRATTLVSLSASGFSLNDTWQHFCFLFSCKKGTWGNMAPPEDMLQSMGWQRVRHDRGTKLNWTRREWCGGESSCVFLSLAPFSLHKILLKSDDLHFESFSNFIIYSYLCIIFFNFLCQRICANFNFSLFR